MLLPKTYTSLQKGHLLLNPSQIEYILYKVLREMTDYDNLSDKVLCEMIAEDHRHAFHALYERYKAALLMYTVRRVGEQDAEDLVHDVFTRVWNNRASLTLRDEFVGYLFKAMRNRIIDHYAKVEHVKIYIDHLSVYAESFSFDLADNHLREQSFRDAIYAMLRQYGPQYQAILKLRTEGYSNPEIAKILGLSEKTIRNKYSSILKIIRAKLSCFLLFLFF